MKVLFLSHDEENAITIKKLTKSNFSKINLIEVDEHLNLVEFITVGGPFSFIVIDIDNKNIIVSDIYETIKETLGARPFVFMGSPNSVKSFITAEMLQDSSVNFILETPILPEEFIKIFKSSIEWVKKEDFEESVLELSRNDLHRVRIRNFFLFDQMAYDVFLELTSTKYGKIIPANTPYSHQFIQNYSKKNVKFLYVKKNEHLKFLDTSIKNLIIIYEAKLSDKKKYISLHLKTIFLIHQFIKALSASDDIIKLTRFFISTTREAIKSEESLSELLDRVTDSPNMTFAEHALATAYICETILSNMEWTADMSRDKILLASILQNIALDNDDMIKIHALNDPNLAMCTKEELEDYKAHPLKAAQIATSFAGFSDVDFILAEHHEQPSGTGFPKGIYSSGLTTISCIFILANNFASNIAGQERKTTLYKQILTDMKQVYGVGNFKEPLNALEKAFKPKKKTAPKS